MPEPVIIVGAGLAGLACARRLHATGAEVIMFDADDRPGGRLKTDVVEGFRLDRGFQVLFTAYPYAKALLNLDALNLRKFEPGAMVFDGEMRIVSDNRKLATAVSPLFSLSDKIRVINWTTDCKLMSLDEIAELPDVTTLEHLRAYEFSERFINNFARPFLGGIFLDRSLSVSVRQFAFIWKMLSEGDTVVPAEGMEAIPRQLSDAIPASALRMGQRVREISREGDRVTGVTLESGERLGASAVVVATDAITAMNLTGIPTAEGMKSSICVYFEAPCDPIDAPILILNAQPGLVNEVVPCSRVAPELAPKGKSLVSATVLGDDDRNELPERIREELRAWFPNQGVERWRHLRTYRVAYAQMPQPPGVFESMPKVSTDIDGLFLCGEYTTDGSINGALKSGVQAADAVIRSMRVSARA